MLVRILAVGLLVLLASAPKAGSVQRGPADKAAVVDHVADGDTIQVQISGREEDIRFIGIDTPEVYGGVECGGPQASASMKRAIGVRSRRSVRCWCRASG